MKRFNVWANNAKYDDATEPDLILQTDIREEADKARADALKSYKRSWIWDRDAPIPNIPNMHGAIVTGQTLEEDKAEGFAPAQE